LNKKLKNLEENNEILNKKLKELKNLENTIKILNEENNILKNDNNIFQKTIINHHKSIETITNDNSLNR